MSPCWKVHLFLLRTNAGRQLRHRVCAPDDLYLGVLITVETVQRHLALARAVPTIWPERLRTLESDNMSACATPRETQDSRAQRHISALHSRVILLLKTSRHRQNVSTPLTLPTNRSIASSMDFGRWTAENAWETRTMTASVMQRRLPSQTEETIAVCHGQLASRRFPTVSCADTGQRTI